MSGIHLLFTGLLMSCWVPKYNENRTLVLVDWSTEKDRIVVAEFPWDGDHGKVFALPAEKCKRHPQKLP